MAWQSTPFTLPLLFATIVFIGLSVLAVLRFRDTVPVLRQSFVALCVAGAIWTLAYALQLSSTGLSAKLAWSGLSWLGIAGVTIAWPVFVLAYAGPPG